MTERYDRQAKGKKLDGSMFVTYEDGRTEEYKYSAKAAVGGLFGAPRRRKVRYENDFSWRPHLEEFEVRT